MKTSIRLFFGVILIAIIYLSGCKKDSSISQYPINLKVAGHDTDYTVWIQGKESTSGFSVPYFIDRDWLVSQATEVSFLNDTQYIDNRYGPDIKYSYFFRNDSFFIWQMPIAVPESSPQRYAVFVGFGNRQKLTLTYSYSAEHKRNAYSLVNDAMGFPYRMTRELWMQIHGQTEMPDTLAIYNYTTHFSN